MLRLVKGPNDCLNLVEKTVFDFSTEVIVSNHSTDVQCLWNICSKFKEHYSKNIIPNQLARDLTLFSSSFTPMKLY